MKTPELHVPTNAKMEEFLALAELGRQAQVIFHDLANHFTSLNLTIQELESNLASEKERFKEYSKRSNETRAQIEYVANLLRSHMRGKNEPFTADKIVREVINLLGDKIRRNQISITLNLDRNILFSHGKRDFIHIVTNLVQNAIESFTDISKTREIRILLKQNSNSIILEMTDSGSGIAKENVPKLFSSGFTTKKNGNGIGLSAVKEKVEKTFKGTIAVQSVKNQTSFKIIIPKQNRKRISPPVLNTNLNFRLLSESVESLRNHSAV